MGGGVERNQISDIRPPTKIKYQTPLKIKYQIFDPIKIKYQIFDPYKNQIQ